MTDPRPNQRVETAMLDLWRLCVGRPGAGQGLGPWDLITADQRKAASATLLPGEVGDLIDGLDRTRVRAEAMATELETIRRAAVAGWMGTAGSSFADFLRTDHRLWLDRTAALQSACAALRAYQDVLIRVRALAGAAVRKYQWGLRLRQEWDEQVAVAGTLGLTPSAARTLIGSDPFPVRAREAGESVAKARAEVQAAGQVCAGILRAHLPVLPLTPGLNDVAGEGADWAKGLGRGVITAAVVVNPLPKAQTVAQREAQLDHAVESVAQARLGLVSYGDKLWQKPEWAWRDATLAWYRNPVTTGLNTATAVAVPGLLAAPGKFAGLLTSGVRAGELADVSQALARAMPGSRVVVEPVNSTRGYAFAPDLVEQLAPNKSNLPALAPDPKESLALAGAGTTIQDPVPAHHPEPTDPNPITMELSTAPVAQARAAAAGSDLPGHQELDLNVPDLPPVEHAAKLNAALSGAATLTTTPDLIRITLPDWERVQLGTQPGTVSLVLPEALRGTQTAAVAQDHGLELAGATLVPGGTEVEALQFVPVAAETHPAVLPGSSRSALYEPADQPHDMALEAVVAARFPRLAEVNAQRFWSARTQGTAHYQENCINSAHTFLDELSDPTALRSAAGVSGLDELDPRTSFAQPAFRTTVVSEGEVANFSQVHDLLASGGPGTAGVLGLRSGSGRHVVVALNDPHLGVVLLDPQIGTVARINRAATVSRLELHQVGVPLPGPTKVKVVPRPGGYEYRAEFPSLAPGVRPARFRAQVTPYGLPGQVSVELFADANIGAQTPESMFAVFLADRGLEPWQLARLESHSTLRNFPDTTVAGQDLDALDELALVQPSFELPVAAAQFTRTGHLADHYGLRQVGPLSQRGSRPGLLYGTVPTRLLTYERGWRLVPDDESPGSVLTADGRPLANFHHQPESPQVPARSAIRLRTIHPEEQSQAWGFFLHQVVSRQPDLIELELPATLASAADPAAAAAAAAKLIPTARAAGYELLGRTLPHSGTQRLTFIKDVAAPDLLRAEPLPDTDLTAWYDNGRNPMVQDLTLARFPQLATINATRFEVDLMAGRQGFTDNCVNATSSFLASLESEAGPISAPPVFGTGHSGAGLATYALDQRALGVDTYANPVVTAGPVRDYAQVATILRAAGPGSRGELVTAADLPTGYQRHSVAVLYDDLLGPCLIDAQNGSPVRLGPGVDPQRLVLVRVGTDPPAAGTPEFFFDRGDLGYRVEYPNLAPDLGSTQFTARIGQDRVVGGHELQRVDIWAEQVVGTHSLARQFADFLAHSQLDLDNVSEIAFHAEQAPIGGLLAVDGQRLDQLELISPGHDLADWAARHTVTGQLMAVHGFQLVERGQGIRPETGQVQAGILIFRPGP